MADAYVQAPPDGAGKMLQTKLNVIGVNNVHAECMYLVKADGTDNPVHQVHTKNALTAAAPTAVSVGVASGLVIAANANRKGLVLVNTSAAYISLNCVAGAAVLYSGITLNPNGGVWVMDEYTYTTAEIRGIASAAASNIAVQEYT